MLINELLEMDRTVGVHRSSNPPAIQHSNTANTHTASSRRHKPRVRFNHVIDFAFRDVFGEFTRRIGGGIVEMARACRGTRHSTSTTGVSNASSAPESR